MERIPDHIVCAYLYVITKHGYPPPAEQTFEHLEEIRNLGFRSIELEGIREQHLLEVYELRHRIKDKLRELDLLVPFFCIVLPELSSVDAITRSRNLELYEKGCEIARDFGAIGVIDNGPLPPYQFPEEIPVVRHYEEETLKDAFLPPGLEWEFYWEDLIDTLQQVCDIAGNYGLTHHLHPALGVIGATIDGFLNLARAIDRPNFRFNFDTANLHVAKENLNLSIVRSNLFVDYIHISDNRGFRNEHLAIGNGNIRWSSFSNTLTQLGFKGHIGIDIGGEESLVDDLDQAYIDAAQWLKRFPI